jgi:cell division protein FtsA
MKNALLKHRSGLVTALDIGSSKICCLIGKFNSENQLSVVGFSNRKSRGVKNGTIVDMEAAQRSILNAVHAAEQMAGTQIDEVFVNLTSGQPSSELIGVELDIEGQEVNERHLRRLIEFGRKAPELSSNSRFHLHTIPVDYSVDNERGIRDPRGMYGQTLSVQLHLVSSAQSAVRNLITCIERCHLEVKSIILSPYASGLASLLNDERNIGVTVVDLGAGTTSLSVFHNRAAVFSDVIPIGGQHITSDIAKGLSTTLAVAERIKALHGSAFSVASDEGDMIDVEHMGEENLYDDNRMPRAQLISIIQPRLEEIFEQVRERLERPALRRFIGRHIVLTGGGAQLHGIRDLASVLLDKQVRIGKPTAIAGTPELIASPEFSTAIGVLRFALETQGKANFALHSGDYEHKSGYSGRITDWLRKYF